MCTNCGKNVVTRVTNTATQQVQRVANANLIAKKSDDATKVKLRYNGGEMKPQTSGCASCGSKGKYATTTAETIQFVSEDAPNGLFSQRFDIGHDYYVTKEQAKKLLQETFTNPAGQVVHKFRVLDNTLLSELK